MGIGTGERVQLFALAGIPLILVGAALAQRTRA